EAEKPRRPRVVEDDHHRHEAEAEERELCPVRERLRVVERGRGRGQEEDALERALLHLVLEALREAEGRGEEEAQPQEARRVLGRRVRVRPDREAEQEERGRAEGEDGQERGPRPPLQEAVLPERYEEGHQACTRAPGAPRASETGSSTAGPDQTRRPWSRKSARSQSALPRSRRWVAISTVAPRARRRSSVRSTSAKPGGSGGPEGPAGRTASRSGRSARARASRWRMPAEKVETASSARSARPTSWRRSRIASGLASLSRKRAAISRFWRAESASYKWVWWPRSVSTRRTASRPVSRSWPSTRAFPRSGRIAVARTRRSVDLPEPFRPVTMTSAPRGTLKLTSARAQRRPYRRERPHASTAAAG